MNENAYKKAIERLDFSVKKARQAHGQAIQAYRSKQERFHESRKLSDLFPDQRLKKQAIELEFSGALDELRNAVRTAWNMFAEDAEKARAELVEALSEADTYRAGDVDAGALELLKSGVMRTQDYRQMAEDFKENAVILALLRKTANEAASKMNNPEQAQERTELIQIAREAKTSCQELLDMFDALRDSAFMLSGQREGRFIDDAIFSIGSLDHWEELTADVIERPGDADDE